MRFACVCFCQLLALLRQHKVLTHDPNKHNWLQIILQNKHRPLNSRCISPSSSVFSRLFSTRIVHASYCQVQALPAGSALCACCQLLCCSCTV